MLALVISFGGDEAFFKELVGKDASLGQVVHPFQDFNVNPSFFVDQVTLSVFCDDHFGDDVKAEAHVFWLVLRSIEVKNG